MGEYLILICEYQFWISKIQFLVQTFINLFVLFFLIQHIFRNILDFRGSTSQFAIFKKWPRTHGACSRENSEQQDGMWRGSRATSLTSSHHLRCSPLSNAVKQLCCVMYKIYCYFLKNKKPRAFRLTFVFWDANKCLSKCSRFGQSFNSLDILLYFWGKWCDSSTELNQNQHK